MISISKIKIGIIITLISALMFSVWLYRGKLQETWEQAQRLMQQEQIIKENNATLQKIESQIDTLNKTMVEHTKQVLKTQEQTSLNMEKIDKLGVEYERVEEFYSIVIPDIIIDSVLKTKHNNNKDEN